MDCDKCGQKLTDEVVSCHLSYLQKIQEKAKKWDDTMLAIGYTEKHNDIPTVKELDNKIVEWKEKARKYDEITNNNPDVAYKLYRYNELEEKARKYDENARLITLFGWIEDTKTLTEIQEKARKWDEAQQWERVPGEFIPSREYAELKEKAKKWDELQKSGPTPAIWIRPGEYERLKNHADKWDKTYGDGYITISKIEYKALKNIAGLYSATKD